MNKITTSILAGVALAAIAAAPASAQTGTTSFNGFGTLPAFSFSSTGYTLTGAPASFNPATGNSIFGTLNLVGSGLVAGTTYNYNTTSLVFTPTGGGTVLNESGPSSVGVFTNSAGVTSYTFSALDGGFSSTDGGGHVGDRLNLSYTAPVPEASTLISFGALLALGGLAVLRRKSVARAS